MVILKVTSLPSIFTVFVSVMFISSNHDSGQDRSPAPIFLPISLTAFLRETYPDEPETSEDGDIIISWHDKLDELEDLHHYEYVYFGDLDFLLLDSFTEPQLLENLASEYLGIENIEDPAKKFTLPPEWLK